MTHKLNIGGQDYDLALTLGDIRAFQKQTGKKLSEAPEWLFDADAISALAMLAVRPKGKLTAAQIDEGLDETGIGILMDFALAKLEAIATPATSRANAAKENPST